MWRIWYRAAAQMRAFPEGGSGIKGPCLCLQAFVIFYWKTKEIEMHKLIWSLPVAIVNIIIVLINEAAVVVPVLLPSFVSEHQKRWHCCGSSAFILKRNLLNCNHISFCDNHCDLSKSSSLQPNPHKALSTGKQTIPLSNPLTSVFASKDVMKR